MGRDKKTGPAKLKARGVADMLKTVKVEPVEDTPSTKQDPLHDPRYWPLFGSSGG